MANPQAEDGHVDISNELVEALAKIYLNPSESRVLWAILRKTYGWHKKYDRISYTQFENLTGMNRRHIYDALKSLIQRKIVTRRGNNYQLEYGIQKNYECWQKLPVGATNRLKNLPSSPVEATKEIVTRRGNTPLPVEATKSLPIEANTKEKKETIQKKIYKIKYGEFKNVLLADNEYQELLKRFGERGRSERIESLSIAIKSKGYKYKSHYATILNWERMKEAKGVQSGTHKQSPRKLPARDSYTRPEDY